MSGRYLSYDKKKKKLLDGAACANGDFVREQLSPVQVQVQKPA